MPAVVGVVFLVALLVTLAGTLATYPILWRTSRDAWRRIEPDKRPRAIAGGAATLALIGFGLGLSIAAPWGRNSFVYVILIGGGGLMVVVLAAVAIQAVQDSRRARRRRGQG